MTKKRKLQRNSENVGHLPKILQNRQNFQLLKARGHENYREMLYEEINSVLPITKSHNTLKGYFLYPSTIPVHQPKLHIVLEESLNRVLQMQAEYLAAKQKELETNAEENKQVIEQIQALLNATNQTICEYENN